MLDWLTNDTETIDPRLRETMASMINTAQQGGGTQDWQNLLDYIVKIRRTPSETTISPGRIIEAAGDISRKLAFMPARIGQGLYDIIANAISKVDMTPVGDIVLKRTAQPTQPLEVPPAIRQNIQRSMWTGAAPRQTPSQPLLVPPTVQPSMEAVKREDVPGVSPMPDISEFQELPVKEPEVTPAPQPQQPTQPKPDLSQEWLSTMEKLATPKPSIDFDQELKRIFTDLMDEYAKKPLQPEEKPKSGAEWLADYARNVAMLKSGIDIWSFKEQKSERERQRLEKMRQESLNLATQMFNARLASLTERARREDAERQARAAHLETLGNLYPNLRSSPAFLASLNATLGIPVADTIQFIKEHTNPTTGKLEGLYLTPIEQAAELAKVQHKVKVDALKAVGLSEEDAQAAAIFGNYDPVKMALLNYKKALDSGNKDEIIRTGQIYEALKSSSVEDLERAEAVRFIMRYQANPSEMRKSLKSLFKTDKAIDSFIAHQAALAYGAKGWKPPDDKDLTFKESKLREAAEVLRHNNPLEIKKFMNENGGIHPAEIVKKALNVDDETVAASQEPYATIKSMFPKLTVDQLAGLLVPGNPAMDIINTTILNRYPETFREVEAKLPAKQPLTPIEMYKIATLLNEGKNKEALEYIHNLWQGKREGLKK